MTQAVKRYIDLDDLGAFVFECAHCKATLSLRLAAVAFNIPHVCPSCQAQWYERMAEGRSVAAVIDQLLAEMNILRLLATEGFRRPGSL